MHTSRTLWASVPGSGGRKLRQAGGGFFPALLLFTSVCLGPRPALAGLSLPTPVSFEYFGPNFVDNSLTSSTVGTLTYTGHPGCGGTCVAVTQLGLDPSVSVNVNEVVYDNTAGGGADAWLGYYVEYSNIDGTYSVKLDAPESLSITDGASGAYAYLAFGQADPTPGSFNPFTSYTLQEADCVRQGCGYLPVGGVTPAPFTADHMVQMVANKPYFVLLEVQINLNPTGQQVSAFLDPQFSTAATGGHFAFSDGVLDSTPEPAFYGVLTLGMAGLLIAARRRNT